MTIKAIKGMRDLLPADTVRFQRLEAIARGLFEVFNFDEIRTPVLEPTELFARAVGAETDIVGKEMYTFADRGGESLTLRPEATASVVRAYVEHRMWERPGLTRLYYAGPMFRRERPQKGRFRQFYQIGAEVLGGDGPQIDYELLVLLVELLAQCGLSEAELVLNSVGCPQCRPAFYAALRSALADTLPQMCGDCQRRAGTNPLRIFDCKVPADQPLIEALPTIANFLDEGCREHFAQLRALLEQGGIRYRLEPRLVRGLDYYVRTAFEFVHGALGAQNALLGGGRYDGLAQALGAPAQAGGGIGFALGEDRFVMAMPAGKAAPAPAAYVIPVETAGQAAALRLAAGLRRRGLRIEVGEPGRKLGRALELAARVGARYAVLVGASEVASGRWTAKELASGEQSEMDEAGLAERLTEAGRQAST